MPLSIMILETNLSWADWGAISQIILTFFTIISVIIAFFTFWDGKKRKKVEISVNLAHYYQENIIPKISLVGEALSQTEAGELMQSSFPRNKIRDFDQEELISLSEKDNIVDYIEKELDLIPITAMMRARDVSKNKFLDIGTHEIFSLYKHEEEEAGRAVIEKIIRSDFQSGISELLNILEWFSMNFVKGIADGDAVYQSLHQSFISIVHTLYFFISRCNKQDCDKYYTNIIELYHQWSDRKKELANKEEEIKRKAKKKTSKVSRSRRVL